MMALPTTETIMEYNIDNIAALDLTAAQALLIEVLEGKVKSKDGVLVTVEPKERKPRGQMARVVSRLESARETLLTLVAQGPTTVGAVLKVCNDAKYGDILFVARQEMEKGTIVETKYGRTNVWSVPK
jgi:hypothetical protein